MSSRGTASRRYRADAGMVTANTTALSASAPAGVQSMSRNAAAAPNHMSVAMPMLSTMPWRCASTA